MNTTDILLTHLKSALQAAPLPAFGTAGRGELETAICATLEREAFAELGVLVLRALIDRTQSQLIAERALVRLELQIARGEVPHGAEGSNQC